MIQLQDHHGSGCCVGCMKPVLYGRHHGTPDWLHLCCRLFRAVNGLTTAREARPLQQPACTVHAPVVGLVPGGEGTREGRGAGRSCKPAGMYDLRHTARAAEPLSGQCTLLLFMALACATHACFEQLKKGVCVCVWGGGGDSVDHVQPCCTQPACCLAGSPAS